MDTMISKERASRKESKNQLLMVVAMLKEKQTEIKHLKEAQDVSDSLRVLLMQKRKAAQVLARQLEEREKSERVELLESHERCGKNEGRGSARQHGLFPTLSQCYPTYSI